MNGKKAKALRKKAYGDYSFRFKKYLRNTATGQLINKPYSPRSVYQKLKKESKA